MRTGHTKAGISMLEIIISMVILALVMAGLVNVFVVSRGYISHTRSRVAAGELGKTFLDPLQNNVTADSWDTASNKLFDRNGALVSGQTLDSALFGPQTIDGVTYSADYKINNTSDGILRKVKVNITWNETY